MAPAIAHFLVGAASLLLVAALLVLRYDLDRSWALGVVVLGGVWGVSPDVHHIAPVAADTLHAAHGSVWADVFAFHHTLDRTTVRQHPIAATFGSILSFVLAVGVFYATSYLRTRLRPPRTLVERILLVACSTLLATAAAGLPVSVYLLNTGTLSTMAILIGGDGLALGWLVLAVCSTLAATALATTLELAVPQQYVRQPRTAIALGLLAGIAVWLTATIGLPLWLDLIRDASVPIPYLNVDLLLALVLFCPIVTLSYALTRGAFISPAGRRPLAGVSEDDAARTQI